MNKKILILLFVCLVVIVFSCGKENPLTQAQTKQAAVVTDKGTISKKGAVQISGVSFFDGTDACNSGGQGAAYALTMTGDLVGCWYTYVDEFACSPSGTYREVGREYFVGTYKGQAGTFRTTYKFEAKYEGCAANGSYIGAEIKGRCQHPIVEGSGTGFFEGVKGWGAFKDDIEAGNYPYRGHFSF